MTAEPATRAQPVLAIQGLTVQYRTRAVDGRVTGLATVVDGVDLELAAGQTLALVGESGSGKSTIAAAVMRLVEPASGRILFQGKDLVSLRGRALREVRAGLQMIFQDPFESLDPRRTVLDTVVESLVVNRKGGTAAQRRELARVALEHAGLTPADRIGARFAHELSGGQRQRVAIAAAMILEPALLVADEPVSMLDVSLRAGILRLMLDLRDRLGTAILFITHDLSLAWMFADRIAVAYLGRVVEQGPSAVLIARPLHPYTQALVSVIPVPQGGRQRARQVLTGEIPNAGAVPVGCRFHPRCPLYRALGEPERCRAEDPTLQPFEAGQGDGPAWHSAACHFAGSTPAEGDSRAGRS